MKRLLGVWLVLVMMGLLVGQAMAITTLDATKPTNSDLISTFAGKERETRAKVNEIIGLVGPLASFGNVMFVSDYTDLAAAVAAIGSTEGVLVVDADVTISDNTTIPSTLGLAVLNSGKITGAYTLTINGRFYADPICVFSGTSVVFGTTTTVNMTIYPDWWCPTTDGTTDNSAAVQAAIDACPDTGCLVKLSAKDWTFNAEVNQTSITIEGAWTGQHGMALNGENIPQWRAYDKTKPILRFYSDRVSPIDGVTKFYTSAILRNFVMSGSPVDSHNWSFWGRAHQGLHIDQGCKGISVEHGLIQGFTDWQVYIGTPVDHPIMDVKFRDCMIVPFSGGGAFGGIGDGVVTSYGDAVVPVPPSTQTINPNAWVTMVAFESSFLWQANPYRFAWDNATEYSAGSETDIDNGTNIVVELNDEQAETDIAAGSGLKTHQFKFRIENDADLIVKLHRERDGNETTLVLDTDYTVSGDHNGTITLASSINMRDTLFGGDDNITEVDGNLTSEYSLRMLRASDNDMWGYIYLCTKSGTSASGAKATAEPHWNHTVGGVTTDGTVEWTTYQRGRLLNLYGAGVTLLNTGVEASHYGGVKMEKTTQPYPPQLTLVGSNISGEFSSSYVVVENYCDDYPWEYSMQGTSPFWSGSYKPKNRPKYDPAKGYAGQTYKLNSLDSLTMWRPTALDGIRIQSFEKGYTPLGSEFVDLYKTGPTATDFSKTFMIYAPDDNITLYTPYKIKLDYAEEVQLPDVSYVLNKTLDTSGSTTTIDGNSTPQIETLRLSAAHPVKLTDVDIKEDNLITGWSDTLIAVGERYDTFTCTNSTITSAIETGSSGKELSEYFTTRKGKGYVLSFDLTLNSGAAPYIYVYSGDAATPETVFNTQPSNGSNVYRYTAAATGGAGYIYLYNQAAGNWTATVSLNGQKQGIIKNLVAMDDNVTVGHNTSYISLRDGADVALATGDVLGLLESEGIWKEIYRKRAADAPITVSGTPTPSYIPKWNSSGNVLIDGPNSANLVTMTATPSAGYMAKFDSAGKVLVDGPPSANMVTMSTTPSAGYIAKFDSSGKVLVDGPSASNVVTMTATPSAAYLAKFDASGKVLVDGPVAANVVTMSATPSAGYIPKFDTSGKVLVDGTSATAPSFTTASLTGPRPTAGSGTGVTVNDAGSLRTQVYKVSVAKENFITGAVNHDLTLATLPAKSIVHAVVADVTEAFVCSVTCTTATLSGTVGISAGGAEFVASFDMDAAIAAFGDTNTEVGTGLNAAGATNGGYVSWAGTPVVFRAVSGTGAWGNGVMTNLSAGAVTFYILYSVLP